MNTTNFNSIQLGEFSVIFSALCHIRPTIFPYPLLICGWFFSMWVLSRQLYAYAWPQNTQTYGFSPPWTPRKWIRNVYVVWKHLLHISHRCGRSPVWIIMCFLSARLYQPNTQIINHQPIFEEKKWKILTHFVAFCRRHHMEFVDRHDSFYGISVRCSVGRKEEPIYHRS